jgi:hypothetical protein
MLGSAGFMRATQTWVWLRFRWPTLEIREVAVLLLLGPVDRERLLTLAFGQLGFMACAPGSRFVIYGGAVRGEHFAVRRTVAWTSAPWRWWAARVRSFTTSARFSPACFHPLKNSAMVHAPTIDMMPLVNVPVRLSPGSRVRRRIRMPCRRCALRSLALPAGSTPAVPAQSVPQQRPLDPTASLRIAAFPGQKDNCKHSRFDSPGISGY